MNLSYDVFVNDPPPQDGFLPNGEPKRFSPMASTLIYGREDAVLTDPGMTEDQARVLGDWVAARGRNRRPGRSTVCASIQGRTSAGSS
jgi:glyoxylase-like metal-dependent hydrolase (beta-lactamase superfamily II)